MLAFHFLLDFLKSHLFRDSNEMLLPSPSKLIARLSMSTSNPVTSGEPQNSASNSSIPSRPLLNPRSLTPSVIVTHDCDLNPILVESFDDTDGFNEAISQIPTEIPQVKYIFVFINTRLLGHFALIFYFNCKHFVYIVKQMQPDCINLGYFKLKLFDLT